MTFCSNNGSIIPTNPLHPHPPLPGPHTNHCGAHTAALRRWRQHIRACVDKRDAAIMEERLRRGIVERRKAECQSEGRRGVVTHGVLVTACPRLVPRDQHQLCLQFSSEREKKKKAKLIFNIRWRNRPLCVPLGRLACSELT